jgi:hypothetical protein
MSTPEPESYLEELVSQYNAIVPEGFRVKNISEINQLRVERTVISSIESSRQDLLNLNLTAEDYEDQKKTIEDQIRGLEGKEPKEYKLNTIRIYTKDNNLIPVFGSQNEAKLDEILIRADLLKQYLEDGFLIHNKGIDDQSKEKEGVDSFSLNNSIIKHIEIEDLPENTGNLAWAGSWIGVSEVINSSDEERYRNQELKKANVYFSNHFYFYKTKDERINTRNLNSQSSNAGQSLEMATFKKSEIVAPPPPPPVAAVPSPPAAVALPAEEKKFEASDDL